MEPFSFSNRGMRKEYLVGSYNDSYYQVHQNMGEIAIYEEEPGSSHIY
jgi:hypothetical protein